MAAERLDVRGTLCPVPVRLTARRVAKLSSGERLEVVGDDPMIRIDLPAWCDEEGHRVVRMEMEEGDGEIRCVIEVA